MAHILIVDDDDRLRQLIAGLLEREGYRTSLAANGAEARALMKFFIHDLMILDVMMPGESGHDVLKSLRGGELGPYGLTIPVMMVTAQGERDQRIAGLEVGADDYLPKPFEPRELLLRIKAILRRATPPESVAPPSHLKEFLTHSSESLQAKAQGEIQIASLRYLPKQRQIFNQEGEEIRLTSGEHDLWQALANPLGQILSRRALAKLADIQGGERAVDVQVARLRRKLADQGNEPRLLATIHGKGYMLRLDSRP